MSGNTIKEYSDASKLLGLMLEDADGEEAKKLNDALTYVREAAALLADEKKMAADALMEAGEMSRQEYDQYMSYVEEFAMENAQELAPYTSIASIGTALTLATAEHNALHSNRFENIMTMESGEELSVKDANFLKSRFAKYTKVFESPNDDAWADAIGEGVVSDDVKNFLECAQNCWDRMRLDAEKDTRKYIMESIQETGDTDFVQECVTEAVNEGVISNFIANRISTMIDHCEITMSR